MIQENINFTHHLAYHGFIRYMVQAVRIWDLRLSQKHQVNFQTYMPSYPLGHVSLGFGLNLPPHSYFVCASKSRLTRTLILCLSI